MRKGMERTGVEKVLELKHVPEVRSCVTCQEILHQWAKLNGISLVILHFYLKQKVVNNLQTALFTL